MIYDELMDSILTAQEQMLKEAGIPYEREDVERVPREEVIALGLSHYFD